MQASYTDFHQNRTSATCILIRSKKMQQMQVFITADLLYMFRASIDPSSEVYQTVTTASGTGHIT